MTNNTDSFPLLSFSCLSQTAILVTPVNLVILLAVRLNRPRAKIAPLGFIKVPLQALNVLRVQMGNMAMLLNKQASLRAKIVGKEDI